MVPQVPGSIPGSILGGDVQFQFFLVEKNFDDSECHLNGIDRL